MSIAIPTSHWWSSTWTRGCEASRWAWLRGDGGKLLLHRRQLHEAKAFGVKTGTRISDARVMCPGIAIVESKPPEYIRFHRRIIEAVKNCIHVEKVLSIDEMWAWLPYNLRGATGVGGVLETLRAEEDLSFAQFAYFELVAEFNKAQVTLLEGDFRCSMKPRSAVRRWSQTDRA